MSLVAERTSAISVHKMHPHIGAEVRGVDLSRPLDDDTLRQIKDAWHQNACWCSATRTDRGRSAPLRFQFRPGRQARAAAERRDQGRDVAWDDMMMITDHVDANGKPVGSLGHGEMWFHTDKCYHRTPAPRDVPLRHRDPVRGRRHPLLEHVRGL